MSPDSNSSKIGTLLSLCIILSMLFPFHKALSSVVLGANTDFKLERRVAHEGVPARERGNCAARFGNKSLFRSREYRRGFFVQNLSVGRYSVTVLAAGNFYCSTNKEVSEFPLNRDFSQILLLAAGTSRHPFWRH
jgi:hypothetical protein